MYIRAGNWVEWPLPPLFDFILLGQRDFPRETYPTKLTRIPGVAPGSRQKILPIPVEIC